MELSVPQPSFSLNSGSNCSPVLAMLVVQTTTLPCKMSDHLTTPRPHKGQVQVPPHIMTIQTVPVLAILTENKNKEDGQGKEVEEQVVIQTLVTLTNHPYSNVHTCQVIVILLEVFKRTENIHKVPQDRVNMEYHQLLAVAAGVVLAVVLKVTLVLLELIIS